MVWFLSNHFIKKSTTWGGKHICLSVRFPLSCIISRWRSHGHSVLWKSLVVKRSPGVLQQREPSVSICTGPRTLSSWNNLISCSSHIIFKRILLIIKTRHVHTRQHEKPEVERHKEEKKKVTWLLDAFRLTGKWIPLLRKKIENKTIGLK